MKAGILLTLAVMAGIAWNGQSADREIRPGSKPYTPTRLEWLTVHLNASIRTHFQPGKFSLSFVSLEKDDTILIYVRYSPRMDRKELNAEIESARKVLDICAKSNGWDGWLRVREDVESY